jgi:hypothetical protein
MIRCKIEIAQKFYRLNRLDKRLKNIIDNNERKISIQPAALGPKKNP